MAHVKKQHAPPPPPVAAVTAQPALIGRDKQDRSSSQSQGREFELSVVLPGGKLSSITIDRSTAMSDVLVLIAQKHKLMPTEHVLSALSEETGQSLSFTALQPIGALQIKRVFLLSKKTSKKEEPTGTLTVVVVLPKGSKAAYEFANKTTIAHAYRVVCAERALDPSAHAILLPGAESPQSPTELTHTTLADSGIAGFTILPLKASAQLRYQSMMDVSAHGGAHTNGLRREQSNPEKKPSRAGSGFLALFKRKKKPKEQPGTSKAGADRFDEDPKVRVSLPSPPANPTVLAVEASAGAAAPAKLQASVKPQAQVTVAARDTGTGGISVPDPSSGEAVELRHTPPKKKHQAPQPPSLRSASSTSSSGGSSGTTGGQPQAEPSAADVVSSSGLASVNRHSGEGDAGVAEAQGHVANVSAREVNGHAAHAGDMHADHAALQLPSPAIGSSTVSSSAVMAVDDKLRATGELPPPQSVADVAADVRSGDRVARPLSAAAATTAGGRGKKSKAPPPPTADRDSGAGEVCNPAGSYADSVTTATASATAATATADTAADSSAAQVLWPVFVAPPPPLYPPPPCSPVLSSSSRSSESNSSRASSPDSVHRELVQLTAQDPYCACPRLDSHNIEVPRSASRNSEASIDTIADVTRSFEQAIVEGQNALKEEWQDMQPKIAEFVASMDVLTSDLHVVDGRSTSIPTQIKPSGTSPAGVPVATSPAPEQGRAPTPPGDYQTPSDDLEPQAPRKPPRMPSLVFANDGDSYDDGQALLSQLPPIRPGGGGDSSGGRSAAEAASTSSIKQMATTTGGDQLDGDRAAGSWLPQTTVDKVSNTDLIVGGSASNVPSHPFASERVWQELGDQRSVLPSSADAQRLLHTLATATLSPHDDAGGSVRGVKGRVRTARSKLFVDEDDGHGDGQTAVQDSGAVGVLSKQSVTGRPESAVQSHHVLTAGESMLSRPEASVAANAGNRADGPAVTVVFRAAVTTTGSDIASSQPVDQTGSVSSAESAAASAANGSGTAAVVVRARRAVVSPSGPPASTSGLVESQRQPQDEAAQAARVGSTVAPDAASPRPDLRAVPEPARIAGRANDADSAEDEVDGKLRTVAGRSAISSSTTQFFSRRSQLPAAAAVEPSTTAAASAGRRRSLQPVTDVASPLKVQPGNVEPNIDVAATASTPSLSAVASMASAEPSMKVNTLKTAAPDSVQQSGSPTASTVVNIGALPSASKLHLSAREELNHSGQSQKAEAFAARGNAVQLTNGADTGSRPARSNSNTNPNTTGGIDGDVTIGRSVVVEPTMELSHTSPTSLSATRQVPLEAGKGNDISPFIRPTAVAGLRPSADSAHASAIVSPAAGATAATPIRATAVETVEETLLVTRVPTVSMDRSPSIAGHQSSPGQIGRDDVSATLGSSVVIPSTAATNRSAATVGDEPARADAVVAPSGQAKKTIFSLLSSLDSNKLPAVKRRSNTLPPTSSEPSDAAEPGLGSQVSVGRAAAVPGAEVTATVVAAPASSGSEAASSSLAGHQAVPVAVVPVATASKPAAAALQARLYSPRPFAARPWSAVSSDQSDPIANAAATTDSDAVPPSGEKKQHPFRLSLSTSSTADAEARRKQELVRRYEDLQKEVAAWRGQLLENEAILKDAENGRPEQSAAAVPDVSTKPNAGVVGQPLERHPHQVTIKIGSSVSDSNGPTVKQLPSSVAPLPGSRSVAVQQTDAGSRVTLESMVAQMTQVKLKPAAERAAKKLVQQPKPSSSREQLMQSIRDRGVRLKLVDEDATKVGAPRPEKGGIREPLPTTATIEKGLVSTASLPLTSQAPPPPPLPPMPSPLQQQVATKAARQSVTVLKSPSLALDPREELMIAIRNFGGSLKLQAATSSPGNTPR